MNSKRSLGFTLTELMVTLAIVGILATIGAPSFVGMLKKSRLQTATQSIYADLQYAKMQSVKQNVDILLTFTKTTNTDWCYGITEKSNCDCTQALAAGTSCSITENGVEMLKVTSSGDLNSMQLTTDANDFLFKPIRSTVSSAGATLSNGVNSVRVKTSGLGRISYCVPDGETIWGGYSAC